uniref:Uncharacterized protein n=1 Tax=Pristionchus pacificus TaxID=54126 RepID=A0A2A6CM14_PRIPA|eukprot:PDM79285.1 hypothetical protein PRIPAC_31864 [Pristionchus pacificus]
MKDYYGQEESQPKCGKHSNRVGSKVGLTLLNGFVAKESAEMISKLFGLAPWVVVSYIYRYACGSAGSGPPIRMENRNGETNKLPVVG